MNQKVLVIGGKKQSGKSTSAKFIHGHLMKAAGTIKDFRIDQDNDLLITLPTGEECLLDIYRQDFEFAQWAQQAVWPFAKIYSFAEELKESCIRIFGVNPICIYGSDADKNKPTHIKWKNIVKLLTPERYQEVQHRLDDFLTHRELLQEFGTICRIFYPDCWIASCWRKIKAEGWPFCIIDDCRYENEVDYSAIQNAYIIRLSLSPYQDNHSSEQIDRVAASKFYLDLDNKKLTIDQKNEQLVKLLGKIL